MLPDLIGKRVTVVAIGSMAMTKVYRGTCIKQNTMFALEFIYVQLDKRNPRQRKIETVKIQVGMDVMVFEGDLPFKADTEAGGCFNGNACFNFVNTTVTVVREIVEKANVNDRFTGRDSVMVVDFGTSGFESNVTPVFPEVNTSSAPVQRYRAAAAEKVAA